MKTNRIRLDYEEKQVNITFQLTPKEWDTLGKECSSTGRPIEECIKKACDEIFDERWKRTFAFRARSDFIARKILASMSGLSMNDTTNQHTTRIIFGKED